MTNMTKHSLQLDFVSVIQTKKNTRTHINTKKPQLVESNIFIYTCLLSVHKTGLMRIN